VLALMAEGRSNAGIGRELHLSPSAVEKHINAIFAKLGLGMETDQHRRVAAVVAYLQHSGHTVPPPDRMS
jgi:DNA-binding NarL/FixJ family response regulator